MNTNTPKICDIKLLVILRGVSGSGKTTISEGLENSLYVAFEKMGFDDEWTNNTFRTCSNDNYFTDEDGNYNFNGSEIPDAIEYCRAEFDDAIGEGANLIVLDNTNMVKRHYEDYIKEAKMYDYKVVQICTHTTEISKDVAEAFFARNVHGVPMHSIVRQLSYYENDSSLERFCVDDVVGFFREKLSAVKSHNLSFERAMRHQNNLLRKLSIEDDEVQVAFDRAEIAALTAI